MHTYRPRAYAQGELDNLCGLYAVINGIRHALHPIHRLSGNEYLWLFQVLAQSDELDRVISLGFNRRQVASLLKASKTIALDRWGCRVDSTRPFRTDPTRRLAPIIETIKHHESVPGRSVIFRFSGHWSVVKHAGENRFDMLDSYEYHRIRYDELRIGKPQTRRDDADWYWLSPSSIFLLRVSPAKRRRNRSAPAIAR